MKLLFLWDPIDFCFPLEEELNELGSEKAAQTLGEGKRHEGFLGHKQLLRYCLLL